VGLIFGVVKAQMAHLTLTALGNPCL